MPAYFLIALEIHIDEVLKQNTLYIFCTAALKKHDTVFKHKATNILEGSLFL